MRRLVTQATRASLRPVVALLAVLLPLLLQASPARAYADDYPWRTDSTHSNDSFGFTKRQCVSYAAWRLYKAGYRLNNARQHWGDAAHWDATARSLGKKVSGVPQVGAVAQWHANEKSPYYPGKGAVGTMQASRYGHVAWVVAVYRDHTVLVRQYNVNGDRTYSQMHVRAPRYLYL